MKNRTYRYFKGKPLYPFGYGLSYSNFRYADLEIKASGDAEHEISARVTNNSNRAGDEVVQLYIGRGEGNPALKGFQRIHMPAGDAKTVHFAVGSSELEGAHSVSVGGGQPIPGNTNFVQQSH